MTHPFRVLAGCFVAAAALWLASSGTTTAANPDLPKDSYKKAADADIAFLQKRLDGAAKVATPAAGEVKPAVGAALLIAVYADALGDDALRTDALKVAELVNEKKYADAAAAAKKLAVKPGAKGGKGDLPKLASFDGLKPVDRDAKYLEHVMTLFRNEVIVKTPGGLHIQQDIRDYVRKAGPKPVVAADVEILAVRTAVINEIATHYPNQTAAANPGNKKKWEDWSKESVDLSKKLVAEAAKGKGADEKIMKDLLTKINARCNDCHSEFRDN